VPHIQILQLGPYGERSQSPESSCTYPSGSPVKEPPSRSPLGRRGSTHRPGPSAGRGPGPLTFGDAGWPMDTLFWIRSGACQVWTAFDSFNFTKPGVSSCGHSAVTALPLSALVQILFGEVRSATGDAPGCVPVVRCVLQKRWQRYNCGGPFRATYDPTVNRGPQSSVSNLILESSGSRATDKLKLGVDGWPIVGSSSQQPELHDALDSNIQGFHLLTENAANHLFA